MNSITQSKHTLRWLWNVTGKTKGYIAALTILQAFAGVIGVIYAIFLRNIVDSAVSRDAGAFRLHVFRIIVLVLIHLSVAAVLRWLNELAESDIENTFKHRLMENVLVKNYASVSSTHTAEWLNRMTNDAKVVAEAAIEILPGLIGTVVRLFSALAMVFILDRWFAYILIPAGAVFILLTYIFRKVLKQMHKRIQEADGTLRIFLQERLGSLMVIKSYVGEQQTLREASDKMAAHKAAKLRRNRFSNVANIGFGAGMQGMYLVGVVYCAWGIMSGTVTYGTLTAIMQLIGQVQSPFANITSYLPRFYSMTASAERLMEVEAYEDDCPEPALDASRVLSFYQEQFQGFGLRNAVFSYSVPSSDSSPGNQPVPVVLRGLSLEIRKGEYVAFTGHSGCGKSSVLKLLLCMYSLTSGERYLIGSDGVIPLTAKWRRLFAYVPQGNQLMNGSLREVIAFGNPELAADEERMRYALSVACADEFLPHLENGLDTLLGERGAGLSEGQMQRIAIARAVFSGSPVLLLDEATSALDEDTEKKLLVNLRTMTDKTLVIVTHRKAALSICDRTLHFTESGVAES